MIPTLTANTQLSAVCLAKSGQYNITNQIAWPGRADDYNYRVDVELIRFTDVANIRPIIEEGIANWAAQWKVLNADIDMQSIFSKWDS